MTFNFKTGLFINLTVSCLASLMVYVMGEKL